MGDDSNRESDKTPSGQRQMGVDLCYFTYQCRYVQHEMIKICRTFQCKLACSSDLIGPHPRPAIRRLSLVSPKRREFKAEDSKISPGTEFQHREATDLYSFFMRETFFGNVSDERIYS
jgi:hypothetical protein